jgi:deoxyhypusine synthase
MTPIEDFSPSFLSSLSHISIPHHVGFQWSNVATAINVLNTVKREGAFFILSFTANVVASGLRGVITDMVRRGLVDLIITTPGALEHDVMKTFGPYYQASFDLDDRVLHEKGLNRVGNIVIPNERYVKLEQFMFEVFEDYNTPLSIARRMGERIEDERSFLYWAFKNNVDVFCPGIVDGAIGLNFFFFKQSHPQAVLDYSEDMLYLGKRIVNVERSGAWVIGGGISKHFTIGLNLLKQGLDYAVYITTANEWDGSLSGARTREAVSWGKIKEEAKHVTVYGEATTIVPLVYAQAFLKE